METIIKKITDNEIENDKIIKTAAEIISRGGLVAFPTETVYGLGGDSFDPAAAAKIYAAKGRPSDNPLIVHISEFDDIYKLSDEVPEIAKVLADKFWPGPLTMIVKKNKSVPVTVTGGLDTVAVRLPSHKVARKLIKESGTFIAAPSANISGRPSPTTAKHVIDDLNGRIDMIIDDGSIEIGLESTIVDLTEDVPVILRPGYVTFEMLEETVGKVRLDKALMTGVKGNVKPKAPGMKYRHYAPKAELTIIEGSPEKTVARIEELVKEAERKGQKAGIMLSEENFDKICSDYKLYDKVIFVCRDNICQSPAAVTILNSIKKDEWLEVSSRGLVVLFSEPYSMKIHSLLRNHGIIMDNGVSRPLEEKDFGENTIILTMTRAQKDKILSEYKNACNVYSIMEFAGGNGDIFDPYGGDNAVYEMFYSSIHTWVNQVEIKLHQLNTKEDLK